MWLFETIPVLSVMRHEPCKKKTVFRRAEVIRWLRMTSTLISKSTTHSKQFTLKLIYIYNNKTASNKLPAYFISEITSKYLNILSTVQDWLVFAIIFMRVFNQCYFPKSILLKYIFTQSVLSDLLTCKLARSVVILRLCTLVKYNV